MQGNGCPAETINQLMKSKNKWTLWADKPPTELGAYLAKLFPLPQDNGRSSDDLDRPPIVFNIREGTNLDDLYEETFEFSTYDTHYIPTACEIAWFGPISESFPAEDIKQLNKTQLKTFRKIFVTQCDTCDDIRPIVNSRAARYGQRGSYSETRGNCKNCGEIFALELITNEEADSFRRDDAYKKQLKAEAKKSENLRKIAAKARELEEELFPDVFSPAPEHLLSEFTRRLDEFKETLDRKLEDLNGDPA